MEKINNIEETIKVYTSAWNITSREDIDRAEILKKISRCWAPTGTYTDKLTDTITGPEALVDLIIGSYEQLGPRTFKMMGAPEAHHKSGRFHWLAIRPEGYPVPGMDYFEFDEQNRITRIVGFF